MRRLRLRAYGAMRCIRRHCFPEVITHSSCVRCFGLAHPLRALEVVLESFGHFNHLLKVASVQNDSVFRIAFIIAFGEGYGGVKGYSELEELEIGVFMLCHMRIGALTITNFTTIPSEPLHLVAFLCVIEYSLRDFDVFSLPFELIEENVPYLTALFVGKVWIVNDHMYARDEAIVEGADSVSREEQYTLIVFKRT